MLVRGYSDIRQKNLFRGVACSGFTAYHLPPKRKKAAGRGTLRPSCKTETFSHTAVVPVLAIGEYSGLRLKSSVSVH